MLTIVSSILSFLAGCVIAKLNSNISNDNICRNKNIESVDLIVDQFNIFINSNKKQILKNETWLDYQVRSLIDDTTLLPIIGRSIFDGEYVRVIAKMAELSKNSPLNMTQPEKDALLKKMNSHAIDLKKIINLGRGEFRLLSRS
jgi:hypothetical protein